MIWDNASAESEKCILKTGILAMKLRYIACTEEEYKEIDIKNYELVLVFSKSNLGFAKGNNAVSRNQLDKFEAIIFYINLQHCSSSVRDMPGFIAKIPVFRIHSPFC